MTGSEDLGQGLRSGGAEPNLERRLGALHEELARLRDQVHEGFARLTGQLPPPPGASAADTTADMALIKAAVEDINEQRSQSDVLHTLVNRASSFAPRIAFFVIKNERVTGWRARGLEGTVGDDTIREISLPLSEDTLLGEAARSRSVWSGGAGAHAGDRALFGRFGGEPPVRMVAVPLVARDKAVAVLYADSAGLDAESINLEALETLVRVSGMAVELL
ncbi:MAG: GAF domain-containing protein, partial [Pyrinomonadaceae bacterium]